MSTVSAGVMMDTTARPRGTLRLTGASFKRDVPLKASPRLDLDPGLIRKWPAGTEAHPISVGIRRDEIGWLIESRLAGKTILGSRNRAEPAVLINAPIEVLDRWWSAWQPRKKRRWQLVPESGEAPRLFICRWDVIGKIRQSDREDGYTWICLASKTAKPVPVTASFDEAFGWWHSFIEAKARAVLRRL